jgi:hypothetical protein
VLISLGRLSIAQLQIGMAAALPGLKLRLQEAKGAQASISANLEKLLGNGLNIDAILAGFNVEAIANFKPLDITKLGLQIQADLDFLNGKLLKLEKQLVDIQAALGVSGITAWAYRGPASDFGNQLSHASQGDVLTDALVLTATDPTAWAALSAVMFVGSVSLGGASAGGTLVELGQIPGPMLLTGLALTVPGLAADIAALAQQIANKSALLINAIELGIQIPQSPGTIALGIAASLPVLPGLAGMLPFASLNLQLDLGARFGLAKATELALAPVVASLEATLGGGGISAWAFNGPAKLLGSELGSALGSSSGDINGFAMSSTSPAAWAALSAVLKVS